MAAKGYVSARTHGHKARSRTSNGDAPNVVTSSASHPRPHSGHRASGNPQRLYLQPRQYIDVSHADIALTRPVTSVNAYHRNATRLHDAQTRSAKPLLFNNTAHRYPTEKIRETSQGGIGKRNLRARPSASPRRCHGQARTTGGMAKPRGHIGAPPCSAPLVPWSLNPSTDVYNS